MPLTYQSLSDHYQMNHAQLQCVQCVCLSIVNLIHKDRPPSIILKMGWSKTGLYMYVHIAVNVRTVGYVSYTHGDRCASTFTVVGINFLLQQCILGLLLIGY